MLDRGEISYETYEDAVRNLRPGLTDDATGISSGGTSIGELQQFEGANGRISPDQVKQFTRTSITAPQYRAEVITTTINGIKYGAILGGTVPAIMKFWSEYKSTKSIKAALGEAGAEFADKSVKGAVRGGAIGFFSSILRIQGASKSIPFISDGCMATVLAGGALDCGITVMQYGKGEIDWAQCKTVLTDTCIKSAATVFFTKGLQLTLGTVNPLVPLAAYFVASTVVSSTREIIRAAQLREQEYLRLAALNLEAAEMVIQTRKQILAALNTLEESQERIRDSFLCTFDSNIRSGADYDKAFYAIVKFAGQSGIPLQHTSFSEFDDAMQDDMTFTLGHRR